MDLKINGDLHVITVLLYSLPASYDNFKCAIETNDELPTTEVLKMKILEEIDARQYNEEEKQSDSLNSLKTSSLNGKILTVEVNRRTTTRKLKRIKSSKVQAIDAKEMVIMPMIVGSNYQQGMQLETPRKLLSTHLPMVKPYIKYIIGVQIAEQLRI